MRRLAAALWIAATALTAGAQEISHPAIGVSATDGVAGGLKLTLVDRRQNWNAGETATFTPSIVSPKSVNIHPSGRKFYVNSLEGATTVVFDAATNRELKVISHVIGRGHEPLWAPESGHYRFEHYTENLRRFRGKPVESAFSHGGRYLWVPYYRRSFDLNAQGPSAIAVIDTRGDSIIRLFETGTLPKMIAVSPDSRRVAVAHWGDNTVGYLDVSGTDPLRWRHLPPFVVDRRLKWDLSLEEPVDRDTGSGNALRGTVFTPSGRYLLVACMGGAGGIAVIDVSTDSYVGKLYGMMPNVRHLIVSGGNLYMSVNRAGYVQRVPIALLETEIGKMTEAGKRSVTLSGCFENAKVGAGARTIVASPCGRYIFTACNFTSSLDVVDTRLMKRVASLPLDSYPVGMDISADGRTLYVTSQGRKDKVPSGNCVDIIRVDYPR